MKRTSFIICHRHGWNAKGVPCPKCRAGDAPKHCAKHGWSSTAEGCPDCKEANDPSSTTREQDA